jgi:hypothetical protein
MAMTQRAGSQGELTMSNHVLKTLAAAMGCSPHD